MTICLLSTLCVDEVKAVNSNPNSAIVAQKPTESEEVQAMIDRVQEIKAMDMSALSPAQKKELRKELRSTKQELKAVQGIYLSIGAILIIILLLILLL